MFATGETVGLAEWIIDDTCLVYFAFIFKCSVLKSGNLTIMLYSVGFGGPEYMRKSTISLYPTEMMALKTTVVPF